MILTTIIPTPQKRKLEAHGVVNAYNPPSQETRPAGACSGVEGRPRLSTRPSKAKDPGKAD